MWYQKTKKKYHSNAFFFYRKQTLIFSFFKCYRILKKWFQAFDLLTIVETIDKSYENSTTTSSTPNSDATESQTSEPKPIPSQEISDCLVAFIACLDSKASDLKSESDLSLKTRNCYKLFQDCSGSVILIPDLYRNTKTNDKP